MVESLVLLYLSECEDVVVIMRLSMCTGPNTEVIILNSGVVLRPVRTSTSMYIECTLKSFQFCPHYACVFAKLDQSQS